MLSSTALRLAALEVLRPTEAINGEADYPTLAGKLVLDSHQAAVSDMNEGKPFTPVIALYSVDATGENRGGDIDDIDFDQESVLEIVIEMAVNQALEAGDGEVMAPVMVGDLSAANDIEATRDLEMLATQVRRILEDSPEGHIFRAQHRGCRRYDMEPLAEPSLGLRWHRMTLRMTYGVKSDRFDEETGRHVGLDRLIAALPADSIVRTDAEAINSRFAPHTRTPLKVPDVAEANDKPTTLEARHNG